jgi:hypothetical protein
VDISMNLSVTVAANFALGVGEAPWAVYAPLVPRALLLLIGLCLFVLFLGAKCRGSGNNQ